MDSSKLQSIRISDTQRRRGSGAFWSIVFVILVVTGGSLYVARPWAADVRDGEKSATNSKPAAAAVPPEPAPAKKPEIKTGDSALTVSGYIINRERIEVSPRMMGQVAWIGVKKGDRVKKDEVIVRLDDAEQRARMLEIEGQLAGAKVAREKARLAYDRVKRLRTAKIETEEREDDARLALEAAEAVIQQFDGMRELARVQLDDAEQKARLAELDGQLAVAKIALDRAKLNNARVQKLRATQNETAEREDETRLAVASAQAQIQQLTAARQIAQVYLDWTIIRSPIDGVVLEKLADPGELVSPQSFGGTRGPSTALVSLGDPNDLQVEIDVNEGDLGKIALGQRCRVSPEAYPEKSYGGVVAEIAPEANRQKGTLQIKVQIERPDHFLTPELSAKVDFLKQ